MDSDSDYDSEDDSKPPKPGYERIYVSCCLYYDRPIVKDKIIDNQSKINNLEPDTKTNIDYTKQTNYDLLQ